MFPRVETHRKRSKTKGKKTGWILKDKEDKDKSMEKKKSIYLMNTSSSAKTMTNGGIIFYCSVCVCAYEL